MHDAQGTLSSVAKIMAGSDLIAWAKDWLKNSETYHRKKYYEFFSSLSKCNCLVYCWPSGVTFILQVICQTGGAGVERRWAWSMLPLAAPPRATLTKLLLYHLKSKQSQELHFKVVV